ncbi:unnamed protein product [Toxocara canis]|uniref:PKD_channel domain-containing protein n=1 Tax=Toxocara canis TaxID=6265 RepID=A0A183UMT6_TOXCA|nr:unnamed protein product [Toxocara canis]
MTLREEVASGYFNSNYFEALYEAGASGNMEEYYIPELSGVDEWTGIERISLLQGFILDGNYTDTLELDSFQDFNFSTFPRALPDSLSQHHGVKKSVRDTFANDEGIELSIRHSSANCVVVADLVL